MLDHNNLEAFSDPINYVASSLCGIIPLSEMIQYELWTK
jgi:hypothetical protein